MAANAGFSALRFVVGVAGALVVSVLVARTLGPQEFGTYRLVLALVWVLEALSVLGFPSAATRYVAEAAALEGPSAARPVLGALAGGATLVWLVGFAGLALAAPALARFYRDPSLAGPLLLGALAVLPGLWMGLASAALQARERFAALSRLALAQGTLGVLGTALVLLGGGCVVALLALGVAVNLAGAALAATAARRALADETDPAGPAGARASPAWSEHRACSPPAEAMERARSGPGPALRRRMWRYAVVVGMVGLVNGVLSERLEIFVLGRFWPPAEVAFYSLAVTLALHARRLGPGAVGEVLLPVIARLQSLGDRWGVGHAWVEATRYLAVAGLPLAAGGVWLAEPVLDVLFGPAYLAAWPAVAVMFGVGAVVALALPAGAVILAREGHGFLLRASLLLAALNLVADLVLIPSYAALGAALANLLTQGVWALVQVLAVARWLGVAPPLADVARTAAVTLLACAPLAALRAWPVFGLVPDSAVGAVLAALLYLPLLVLAGAVRSRDLERLRATADRLPARFGRLTGPGLGLLQALARR